MGVVVLGKAVRYECGWLVSAQVETTDGFFDAATCISIAQMDRVVRIKLIVAFDGVLDLSVFRVGEDVAIAETDRIRSRTARE